jgi:predicted phage terminase large subunit-like protein
VTFDLDNSADLHGLLAECYGDTKVCAKVLFPDLFYSDFSPLHDQIFDIIDSGAKKIAIAAPRGIGKTTIARTLAAKSILYRDLQFVSYVSNSATAAEMQTENIKRELMSNLEVKKLFGNVKIADTNIGLDDSFSKLSWVAFGNTLVMPRGAGQQVRGLIWKKYRPQLIIIDDLEDKEEVMNDALREKLSVWFFGDLLKSVNRYLNDWRIIYIDTLKHEDSLLQKLIDSSDWESITLSICDNEYNSLAPQYITTEELREEVEEHREKGMLDVFYMEYMNLPISREDASFKPEYFKYYEDSDIADKKHIETVVIVDPAKTVKMQSAESALVAIGIDRGSARIYVRDVVSRKMYPDEIYDEMFKMAARNNAKVVGIEVTSLNEFITQPVKNEMFKRGQFFELVELKPRAKKEERVASLVPFYRQGYVYHNSSCCAGLEAQLLMFPRAKLWDIMDAFAYIVEMLELGDRYFEPPYDEDEDPEEEFKELDYDEPIDNWRFA